MLLGMPTTSSDRLATASLRPIFAATTVLLALAATGCSLERLAAKAVGSSLAGGGAVWASDDDPELVAQAMPFALKTVESLLAAAPDDQRLLLSACAGFTQYGYAFVAGPADEIEGRDPERARAERVRAARLYARALIYGRRGLAGAVPGLEGALAAHDSEAVGRALTKADRRAVPLLYWTALAWGARISATKDDPELVTDLPTVERLMRRARELEPGYGGGAIWDFYIAYDGGRPAAGGGSVERARAAFAEAIRLAGGRRAGPYVALAESVAVAAQDRAEFKRLLEQALAVDASQTGDQRLANLLAQRRARWLLGRVDELFID